MNTSMIMADLGQNIRELTQVKDYQQFLCFLKILGNYSQGTESFGTLQAVTSSMVIDSMVTMG